MQENNERLSLEAVKRKRMVYLIASACGLLVLGLVYAWSIFATPIALEYGWDKGALQTTFNIAMICFCTAALLGSFINKVLPLKATFLLAGAMLALGFVGTALLSPKSLMGIYISYGVLCGAGCGMGYNLVIATTNSWFPDKIGFASGVMMMGMGLGSLLLGTAANSLINAAGIQAGFFALAVLAFVVVLALALFLKPAPDYVAPMVLEGKKGASGASTAIVDDNPLKDPMFYVYMVWAIFTIAVGITLIGASKQGALLLGVHDTIATLVVGLCSTMNGVSRLVVGSIYDKAGLKAAIFTSGIVTTLSAVAITSSYVTGFAPPYIVAAVCMGFGYGAIPVIASAFARERYGAANYARNFALINMAAAIGSFLSIGLIALASPDGTSTNTIVWLVFSVLAIIALADAGVFASIYKKTLDKRYQAR